MSDKKYQIFISSTYLDLKTERQAVSRSILNLGHVPSSMELFPASDFDQLSFIKKAIDLCDYYVLILGGRYGSLSSDGLSYTEKEYNYALEQKIPVLSFVHADTGELKSKNVEQDEGQIGKLSAFRDRVRQNRICKDWSTTSDLESSVVIALTAAFNEIPRPGWRRDTGQVSAAALAKIQDLQKRLEDTQKRYWAERSKVTGYEDLRKSKIELRYLAGNEPKSVAVSGEAMIREFAAKLRRGLSDEEIADGIHTLIEHVRDEYVDITVRESSIDNVRLFFEVFDICEENTLGELIIKESSKYLLRAAFMPLADVMDDIPF